MKNRIVYYKVKFRLASPLAVGSGENMNTDSDVILDSRGAPVIPASSLAGTIRHFLLDIVGADDDIWGTIDDGGAASRIRFYDAVSVSDNHITIRDSVAISNKISEESDSDEILHNKVGVNGAKFDKEAVEADADLVTMIELNNASDKEKKDILLALSAIDSGFLRLGSKTTRGYGRLRITSLKTAEFILPEDRAEWLGFDQYDLDEDDHYTDISDSIAAEGFDKYYDTVSLRLKQLGGLSVRSYTVKDISKADYAQLSDSAGYPVVPGTSWSGAFRSRFKELSGDTGLTKKLFGYVDTEDKSQQRSMIIFSESRIEKSISKLITRNSIDRFSGGVKESALYSEKTCYYGETVLEIIIRKDIDEISKCRNILAAVICDLDRGYLSVGGLTAVGRGLFEVTDMQFNGRNVTSALKNCDITMMMGDDENV